MPGQARQRVFENPKRPLVHRNVQQKTNLGSHQTSRYFEASQVSRETIRLLSLMYFSRLTRGVKIESASLPVSHRLLGRSSTCSALKHGTLVFAGAPQRDIPRRGLAGMARLIVTQLEHVGPRKQSPPASSCITLSKCLVKPSAVRMSCAQMRFCNRYIEPVTKHISYIAQNYPALFA